MVVVLDALTAFAGKDDLPVLRAYVGRKNGQANDFKALSEMLFVWAKGKIAQ